MERTITPTESGALIDQGASIALLDVRRADDHEMLAQGMILYDALYAWCRSCRDETHDWRPTA